MSRGVELVEVWRPVIGAPDQVWTALETAWNAGSLVTCRPAQRLTPDTVKVMALLRESPPRPPWWRLPSVRGALVATSLAAALALVWLVVWSVMWLVAWVAAHWVGIVAGVVLLGVLVLWLVGSGKCPGIHCDGCNG